MASGERRRAMDEGGRERLKSKAKLKTIETVNLFFTARHRIDGFSLSTDNQRRWRGQIELYYKLIVFLSAPSCLMKQKMISDVRMRSRNMSRVAINLSQNLSPNTRHSVTCDGFEWAEIAVRRKRQSDSFIDRRVVQMWR